MRKLGLVVLLLLLLVGIFAVAGLNRYVDITAAPEAHVSATSYEIPESHIATELRLDNKDVELALNELFKEPFSDSGTGEFREKYQAKTKNPAYDPVEWIKTKNPFYDPKKWIKIKAIGLKTKNPKYSPNKWIKTKNPKYNPNKWIYADIVEIEVGYRYDYRITKREPIRFEAVGNDALRVTVPLSVDGDVGFRGELAKIGLVEKKNIKARADVRLDVRVDIQPDWCPKVHADLDLQWLSGPAIEIAGGVWLDLKAPARIVTPEFEKEAEKAMEQAIDCAGIQKQVIQFAGPSSFEIPTESEALFLNVEPLQASTSGLFFDERYARLQLASSLRIEVADEPLPPTDAPSLPPLSREANPSNLLQVALPLRVGYSTLADALNGEIDLLNHTLAEDLGEASSIAQQEIERLRVLAFQVYPSGDSVTVGLEVEFKAAKDFFSTKGKVFLSATPVVSESNVFQLQNMEFATQLDNPVYGAVLAFLHDPLAELIEARSQIDLAPEIEFGREQVMASLREQVAEVNGLHLEILEISLDLSQPLTTHPEYLVKTVHIHSGFEAELKMGDLLKDLPQP